MTSENRSPMEMEYILRWRFMGTTGYVSCLRHCQTNRMTDLCLFDIGEKIASSQKYDIGGTYTGDEPDFWFFFTTSVCHGFNFLINIFVVPRRPTCFSIKTPRTSQFCNPIQEEDSKFVIACAQMNTQMFRTTLPDENVYVSTYQYSLKQIKEMDSCILYLPVSITLHSKLQLDKNVVKSIKLYHNLNKLKLSKETADFTFITKHNQKSFPIHKVLLASHSSVLRDMISNGVKSLILDVREDVMEIIIEFLYTGAIKNISMQELMVLLNIADDLKITQLFSLAQQLLAEEVNVRNAIEIAVLADKFKLVALTIKVFDFIKAHPKVLDTEDWHRLTDVNLIKSLLKYIHPPNQN